MVSVTGADQLPKPSRNLTQTFFAPSSTLVRISSYTWSNVPYASSGCCSHVVPSRDTAHASGAIADPASLDVIVSVTDGYSYAEPFQAHGSPMYAAPPSITTEPVGPVRSRTIASETGADHGSLPMRHCAQTVRSPSPHGHGAASSDHVETPVHARVWPCSSIPSTVAGSLARRSSVGIAPTTRSLAWTEVEAVAPAPSSSTSSVLVAADTVGPMRDASSVAPSIAAVTRLRDPPPPAACTRSPPATRSPL